jgi:hypothetical protein
MFIGDGSSLKTSFDGSQTAGTPDLGWFSLPLSLAGFSEYLLENPEVYSTPPQDGDILVYSGTFGKPIWVDNPGTAAVYITTNAAVEAAPGATLTDKINNVLGISPLESDSVVVSGVPGDEYQGLYLFTGGVWAFAAGYAGPTAQQVPYNNLTSGLAASDVQAAVDELQATKLKTASNTPTNGQVLSWSAGSPVWVDEDSVYPTAAQVTYDNSVSGIPSTNVQGALTLTWQKASDALSEANSAQDDATAAQVTANIALNNSNTALTNSVNAQNDAAAALSAANAALPKAGGTMTGNIVFNNGQPVDAGTY